MGTSKYDRSMHAPRKSLVIWENVDHREENICGPHGPRRPESSLPVYKCIDIGPWDISEASMRLCDDCKPHRDHGSGLAYWPPVAPPVAPVGTWHDRRAVPGARLRITCVGHAPLIYAKGAVPFVLDCGTPGRRNHRLKYRRAAYFRPRGHCSIKRARP